MNYLSLAARYRPQTFADVAGQPLAAIALSRAAAEDRVAPAYLLSGTRGVGKTTIARIFAKALNCQNGPAAEPCNECAQCRHITAGNHVDVNEIDAASNTGVDDVRALRETIGFVPMEGRYKIFIIDEAHMLSKSAFNALLKTLEEPPAHTVFILATTEAHRFPATIISRCQHFVFKHLPEQAIYEHIAKVLNKEGVEFEEDAARILARRAAGSVRDSLSLLDQTLALANGKLSASAVRSALGVAGPELFGSLLDAIASRDCAQIVELSSGLLASGIDMGFFTRELGALLRNLFLVRQSGKKVLGAIANLTADEKAFLKNRASGFSAAHLHAAWQMILDSQRGITQSPEPGAALELLLLNIALLPQLLPIGAAEPTSLRENGDSSADSASGKGDDKAESQSNSKEKGRESESEEAGAEYQSHRTIEPNWADFCRFCKAEQDAGEAVPPQDILRHLKSKWNGNELILDAPSHLHWERLCKNKNAMMAALKKYCNGAAPDVILPEPKPLPTMKERVEAGRQKPELQLCEKILGAKIEDYVEEGGNSNA